MGKDGSVDQTVSGPEGSRQTGETQERAGIGWEDSPQKHGWLTEKRRRSEQTDGEEPRREQIEFRFLQERKESQQEVLFPLLIYIFILVLAH